jgi:hypothetical protein
MARRAVVERQPQLFYMPSTRGAERAAADGQFVFGDVVFIGELTINQTPPPRQYAMWMGKRAGWFRNGEKQCSHQFPVVVRCDPWGPYEWSINLTRQKFYGDYYMRILSGEVFPSVEFKFIVRPSDPGLAAWFNPSGRAPSVVWRSLHLTVKGNALCGLQKIHMLAFLPEVAVFYKHACYSLPRFECEWSIWNEWKTDDDWLAKQYPDSTPKDWTRKDEDRRRKEALLEDLFGMSFVLLQTDLPGYIVLWITELAYEPLRKIREQTRIDFIQSIRNSMREIHARRRRRRHRKRKREAPQVPAAPDAMKLDM